MGLSYDCTSSILLCAEDNNNILCLDDDDGGSGDGEEEMSDLYFGDSFFLMGFPQHSDECLDLMVRKELEHMSREDYAKRLLVGAVDVSVRRTPSIRFSSSTRTTASDLRAPTSP